MSLWQKLKSRLQSDRDGAEDLQHLPPDPDAGDFVLEPPVEAVPSIPEGRVIRANKTAEYRPYAGPAGSGRVVRVMPRELRQVKEGQERE